LLHEHLVLVVRLPAIGARLVLDQQALVAEEAGQERANAAAVRQHAAIGFVERLEAERAQLLLLAPVHCGRGERRAAGARAGSRKVVLEGLGSPPPPAAGSLSHARAAMGEAGWMMVLMMMERRCACL